MNNTQMLLFDATSKAKAEPAKYCRGCGEEKPLEYFYRRKRNPDGYGYLCANCENPNRQQLGPVRRIDQPHYKKKKKRARQVSNYALCQSQKEHLPRLIERDRFCRICGSTHNLETHLVDCTPGNRSKLDYLTCLCMDCHNMVHKNRAA